MSELCRQFGNPMEKPIFIRMNHRVYQGAQLQNIRNKANLADVRLFINTNVRVLRGMGEVVHTDGNGERV